MAAAVIYGSDLRFLSASGSTGKTLQRGAIKSEVNRGKLEVEVGKRCDACALERGSAMKGSKMYFFSSRSRA